MPRLQPQCCHRGCASLLMLKDDFKLNRQKFLTELNEKTTDRSSFIYNFLKQAHHKDMIWKGIVLKYRSHKVLESMKPLMKK